MASLATLAITKLAAISVDMKTAASTTIYTVPSGRTLRIHRVVIRDASASLAGGTSYAITGFRSGVSFANLVTANTGYIIIEPVAEGTPTQYTEQAAGTAIQLTVTTGSTAVASATVELYGVLS